MAKLAPTQEPSMEEILASIRRIITEDESSAQAPAGRAAQPLKAAPQPRKPVSREEDDLPPPEPKVRAPAPAPSAEVLELSEEQMTPVQQAAGPIEEEDEAEFEEMPLRPAAVHASAMPLGEQNALIGTSLLSASTDAAVTSAFSTLANTILSTESRTLEDLVREMLRPMLKSWLDSNLPPLVERLVREEIERVARGRR